MKTCTKCGGSWAGVKQFDTECAHDFGPEPEVREIQVARQPLSAPLEAMRFERIFEATYFDATLGPIRVEHPTREGAIAAWKAEWLWRRDAAANPVTITNGDFLKTPTDPLADLEKIAAMLPARRAEGRKLWDALVTQHLIKQQHQRLADHLGVPRLSDVHHPIDPDPSGKAEFAIGDRVFCAELGRQGEEGTVAEVHTEHGMRLYGVDCARGRYTLGASQLKPSDACREWAARRER